MRTNLIAILFVVLAPSLYAQMSKSEFNQKFVEANQLMTEKLWLQSIDIWLELHEHEADNANVNYKLGYCYLQTANQKLKSLSYLEKASERKFVKNYDYTSSTEDRPPVEVLYYLGRGRHLNYEMDKAIASYEQLLKNIPQKHHLHKDALRQIEMCEEAKIQVANPQNYVITNLGPRVNTASNEYSPVVSLDESALFYTSRRMRPDSSNIGFVDSETAEHMEDIYVSYKNMDGEWMEAEMLEISDDGHEATIGVSADGQTLYVYVDEAGDGSIMKSKLVGETWSDPQKLSANINTDAWETHASVTPDYSTLYFTTTNASFFGNEDRDIQRCVKLPNGEWSKPLNLGNVVNTEYDEESPFISADSKTLYFSSKGHNSMGGFDIFYSTLQDDGSWSKPENIGYPLNTVDDDVFFVPSADGKRAYYSSEKEEGYGLKDIYLIELPDSPIETDLAVLKGYIYKPEGGEFPDETLVRVTNEDTGEITEYRPRQRDGAYVAVLPPCIAYKVEYMVSGDVVHEDFVNVPCESAYTEIKKEVYLLPVYLDGEIAGYEADVESESVEIPIAFTPDTDIKQVAEGEAAPGAPAGAILALPAAEITYQRYFGYDLHEFDDNEKNFYNFIEDVVAFIDVHGSVEMNIESSASKVPTSKFKSNEDLARFRSEAAKVKISAVLKRKGYTEDDFSFVEPQSLVQGPDYNNDAWQTSMYGEFQYVKVTLK